MFVQESTLLFDLSPLRDNILLDAKQEAFVRATVSSTQGLIAGLDAKIQHIENELAELHKQWDAALESMMIPTALVAPVRNLPPEVLGEIFQRCVPIEPFNDTSFDTGDAPLLLTRVCHRWRQVAQGTPLIWNKLFFYGRTRELFYSSIWLNNSGSVPLEISVGVTHPLAFGNVGNPTVNSEYPLRWRADFFMGDWVNPASLSDATSQIVVGQLPRIRRLSLVCKADELKDYLPREAMTTLSSLQELFINFYHLSGIGRGHSFHNILAPRLHTLVLSDGAYFLLPALEYTSNLRNLEIEGDCTLDMFVDFVSRCLALERIYAYAVDACSPRESMDMSDMSDIVLSGLSHLALGVLDGGFNNDRDHNPGDWSYRTKSLQRLRTPNLQYADIRYLSHVERFLCIWIADSQSRLHTLTIRETPLVDTLLGDAMSILTAVERIEFLHCRCETGFWELVTPAEYTPFDMWTLPKLKILYVKGLRFPPRHEGEFLKFVERRAPPMRSQGQPPSEGISYLVEVRVSGQCYFFSTERVFAKDEDISS